jgi:hypothetical protein
MTVSDRMMIDARLCVANREQFWSNTNNHKIQNDQQHSHQQQKLSSGPFLGFLFLAAIENWHTFVLLTRPLQTIGCFQCLLAFQQPKIRKTSSLQVFKPPSRNNRRRLPTGPLLDDRKWQHARLSAELPARNSNPLPVIGCKSEARPKSFNGAPFGWLAR